MENKHELEKIATMAMPYGRYQGKLIMDLPEGYLLWFEKKGFPAGELGRLLQLMLEIDRNGLTDLLEPLRNGK